MSRQSVDSDFQGVKNLPIWDGEKMSRQSLDSDIQGVNHKQRRTHELVSAILRF